MQGMARERGLADYTSNLSDPTTGARTPRALTRGEADTWIQYVKSQGGDVVKRVYHADKPPTRAQIHLLQELGPRYIFPKSRGEADAMIQRATGDWLWGSTGTPDGTPVERRGAGGVPDCARR